MGVIPVTPKDSNELSITNRDQVDLSEVNLKLDPKKVKKDDNIMSESTPQYEIA